MFDESTGLFGSYGEYGLFVFGSIGWCGTGFVIAYAIYFVIFLISTIVGSFSDVKSPILVTDTYLPVVYSENTNPNLTILVIVSICWVICTVYGTLTVYCVYNCKIADSINYFILLIYAYLTGSLCLIVVVLVVVVIFVLVIFVIYSTCLFNYVLLIITYWLFGINISIPFSPDPTGMYEPGFVWPGFVSLGFFCPGLFYS